jgi:hypothetical protein
MTSGLYQPKPQAVCALTHIYKPTNVTWIWWGQFATIVMNGT